MYLCGFRAKGKHGDVALLKYDVLFCGVPDRQGDAA